MIKFLVSVSIHLRFLSVPFESARARTTMQTQV
jgi:hypothetical protein